MGHTERPSILLRGALTSLEIGLHLCVWVLIGNTATILTYCSDVRKHCHPVILPGKYFKTQTSDITSNIDEVIPRLGNTRI